MQSNLIGSCLKGVAAACVAVLSVSGSAFGATKNVPSDYSTLEAAIAAADDNDEIVISTGTYELAAEISIVRPLTIRSATGKPEDVVIAASGAIRLFTLNHDEACIESVTFANGKPNGYGGAVQLDANGGIIRNCVATNCIANGWGAGGGAFYLKGANALVENCVVSNCSHATSGNGFEEAYRGGLAAYIDQKGTIRNSLFVHNKGQGDKVSNGGATVVLNNGGLLESCTVVGNDFWYSSGIHATGTAKVRDCLIFGNTSRDDQNGCWTVWKGTATCFTNCIAPIYINDFCIVTNHFLRDFAHGDFTPAGAAVDAGLTAEWQETAVDIAGRPRVSGSAPDIGCFEADQSVAAIEVVASVVRGLAPLEVVFTPRVYGLPGTQTIEWDLEGADSWNVESAGAVTKTFAAGRWTVRARVKGSDGIQSAPTEIVSSPKTLYVDPACGTPEFPYGDEDHAATTVAEAYDAAADGSEIVLAPTTHTLADTLFVQKGVTLRGATDDAADTVITLPAKSPKRVLMMQHPQAFMSVLTVTGGACDGNFSDRNNGGAVYVNPRGGSISNCVFRDNKTQGWAATGGALWLASPSALVTHCVFSNNTCEASGNTGNLQGGGMAAYMTAGTIRNSLFIRNTSGTTSHNNCGGTVFMTDGVLESCSFAKNTHTYASGVRATGGVVRNCLIGGNTCTGTASYEGHGEQWVGKAACFESCLTDGAVKINDSCDVANDPFTSVATEDLTPCAAAVDTATPQDWMVGATDLAGLARIQGKGPDLGCYEKDMSKFSAIVEVDKTKAIAPYEATFTVTLFGVGDQGVTCSWDWDGDGTWDETTDGSTTHVFEAGSYSTRVMVTDKASGKTSAPELPFELTMVPKTIYVDDASEHPAAPYQNWDCAAKTLADAYAVAVDECEIVMATGTYDVSTVLELKQNVAIRSVTGNPNDVVLRMAKGANSRHFIVNNALASLSGVTLENGSGNGGGAVLIEAFGGTVSNCVFSGNTVTSWGSQGGAITLKSAAALVTHCVFTNNLGGSANNIDSGDTQGGSHAVSIESGTVRNSLFVNNGVRTHTASKGGVVTMGGGILENCTFARNADGYCAGVRAYNAAAVVRNCVFAEYDCPNASSAAMAVIFNAVTADRFDHCCSPVEFGGSWIKTDTPFVDATHGDWSPAAAIVDKAAPQDWMDGATDLAGNARVSGSAPDIGCYEKDQDRFSALVEVSALRAIAPYEATFTVTTFGVGDKGVTCSWDWNGDGTWDDTSIGTTTHVYDVGAHATKVKVVDNASGAIFEPAAPFDLLIAPKTICVDCNSENPSAPYQNWNCAAKTLADAYAVAVDGCEIVVVTGTYGVSSVIEVLKEVTFRSATGNPRDVVVRMADKAASRHFFLNNAQSALLGLTLENASGLNGGSVFIEAFGGTVSNCVFSGNKSSSGWGQQGGAIYLNSTAALVTHCVFTNNLGGSASNIDSGNSQGGGHALHIEKGNVRNCLFVGNGNRTHKASKGGVVVMAGGALENCTFVKNADSHCAGVHAYNAAAVVRNCLFAEYDCPDATSEAMAVIFDAATASRYDHCCSPVEFGGSWVKATDPQFRKPAKGDWRLQATSPAVNAGVWCNWMDGATDLLGNPRKVLENPDIGCYECPCSGFMMFVR